MEKIEKMNKISKINKNKRAQEEMIGFVLILIIVAVIILVFLTMSLRKSDKEVESYEVEAFIQTLSQSTTSCSTTYYPNYLDVRSLVKACFNEKACLSGKPACEVLNETLNDLIDTSWQIGENRPNKAYFFNSTYQGKEIFSLEKGNTTRNSKGAAQNFQELDIYFKVYF